MSNSSIWFRDRTLPDPTTAGHSGPGNDGNEGVLPVLKSSSITGASSSDCLMLLSGHSFFFGGGSYSYAEMQSVYSAAPAVWAAQVFLTLILLFDINPLIISLYTVKVFQVLWYNTNNLTSVICFHIVKWLLIYMICKWIVILFLNK